MPPRYKATNILIFNVFIFYITATCSQHLRSLKDWLKHPTYPFFVDTDSKTSSFLGCDFDLCTITGIACQGCQKAFSERVSSLSYKPRASPEFPGMSRFVWDSLHFARLWTWAGTHTRSSARHCRWAGLAHGTELSLGLGYLRHITVC